MNLDTWWELLPLLQKIYWILAVPSTIIFLVQLIMLFVGGDIDTDADADADFDGDHGDGIHVFSVKSVVSFLMFFGWSGLAAADGGLGMFGALAISFTTGLIMMLLTAWVFMLFLKLQASGTMDIKNAVGTAGEVYLSIPPRREGFGKVQLVIQGGLRTMDAVTEESETIKTGSKIEVVDVDSSTLIVKSKR